MYNKRIYLHQRHATFSTTPHQVYILSFSCARNLTHQQQQTTLKINYRFAIQPRAIVGVVVISKQASNPMCVCMMLLAHVGLSSYTKFVISSGNTFIYQFQITVTSMRSPCCCMYALVWHIHTYTNTNLNAEAFITTLMPYSNIILSGMPIFRTDLFTAAPHA